MTFNDQNKLTSKTVLDIIEDNELPIYLQIIKKNLANGLLKLLSFKYFCHFQIKIYGLTR